MFVANQTFKTYKWLIDSERFHFKDDKETLHLNLQSKSNIRLERRRNLMNGDQLGFYNYFFWIYKHTHTHRHHKSPVNVDGVSSFINLNYPFWDSINFWNKSLSTPIDFFSHLFTSKLRWNLQNNQTKSKRNETNCFEAFPMARAKKKHERQEIENECS